jgi:polar amino acid transport system substrate-binding protein
MPVPRIPRRVTAVAGLLAVGLVPLLAACGGDDTSTTPAASSTPSASANTALAGLVPKAIAADGTITVGTDTTYAPSEVLAADGKTVTGFDIELFTAVAAQLGLEAKYVSTPFPTLINAVQSGKYEIGVSSFTVNPQREKVVDMVSYFNAGTQWAAQKGNPSGIQPDNACGKRVAVQKGTVQVDDVTARSTRCTSDGKPAITVDQYQGQDQATASVVSGKDDAMLADSPVVAYAVKQSGGKLESLGDIYLAAPYGYVIKKGQAGFVHAVSGAVEQLIKDGTYEKILTKWGVQQGAVDHSEINPVV